jgi:hypothetical protein
VGRSIDSERLWSGIEELGLLMELVNFKVEIPTLKCSNSTIKVGFSWRNLQNLITLQNFPRYFEAQKV